MVGYLFAAMFAAGASLSQPPSDSVLALRPTRYELELTVDHAKRELRPQHGGRVAGAVPPADPMKPETK